MVDKFTYEHAHVCRSKLEEQELWPQDVSCASMSSNPASSVSYIYVLSVLRSLSEPQFPCLYGRDNDNESTHVKFSHVVAIYF